MGPLALRRFNYFESTDVDDIIARIAAVTQPHTMCPRDASPVRGRMDVMHFGQSMIGAVRFGAMEIDVGRMEDVHALMMCVSGHGSVHVDGEEVQVGAHHAVVCPPGATLRARFSADCEHLLIRLPVTVLRAHTGDDVLLPAARLDLMAPSLQPWLRQLHFLISDESVCDMAVSNPRVGIEYERLLIELLQAHAPEQERAPRWLAPAVLRRAEAFMDANAASVLTLQDIAAAADAPARTLSRHFRHFRGTTPMQWLRDMRLERARTKLLRPQPEDSVTTVATILGFSHLGRFSCAYRERFHETPSQTLRRARHGRTSG